MKISLIRLWVMLIVHAVICRAAFGTPPFVATDLPEENKACYLADPDGRILVSVNCDQALIPASILKILTALTAYHYLGADHRFKTDLYLDSDDNLKIKGYGDPLLTSEVLASLAEAALAPLSSWHPGIQHLILDSSFFTEPLAIPGVSDSLEPYDAPNGALSANFNTVSFMSSNTGVFVSAEPQTPLVPSVLPRIQTSGLKEGRIPLSNRDNDVPLYLGELLAFHLTQRGIIFHKGIQQGSVNSASDRCILSFSSPYSLDDTLSKLMAYSSNFIANQLFLSIGAKAFGPPGTLEKGVRATRDYAENVLGISNLQIVEGSGISRENRVSARTMARLLQAFFPHRELMRQTEREYYKTGTMDGISTRAGFLKGDGGKLYPFVVMLNTKGQSMDRVMEKLHRIITH
jgi:serine-type D-Ala-D-Ala carboxypeptidase/endopeptidase (penicillin-binding protein 4)